VDTNIYFNGVDTKIYINGVDTNIYILWIFCRFLCLCFLWLFSFK
jgi:hypothetical protein